MKPIRTIAAGITLAIVAPATLAGCGSQPATPAAAPFRPARRRRPHPPARGPPRLRLRGRPGVLTYGISTTRAVLHANPETAVRVYEVETVTAAGQHHYVVAVDISAAQHD
jgi:hypothetical protein